jgi:hypothetical protein
VYSSLDSFGVQLWTVYVHDLGMMVPGMLGSYGRAFNKLKAMTPEQYRKKEAARIIFELEISKVETNSMPGEIQGQYCHMGDTGRFTSCLEAYVQEQGLNSPNMSKLLNELLNSGPRNKTCMFNCMWLDWFGIFVSDAKHIYLSHLTQKAAG